MNVTKLPETENVRPTISKLTKNSQAYYRWSLRDLIWASRRHRRQPTRSLRASTSRGVGTPEIDSSRACPVDLLSVVVGDRSADAVDRPVRRDLGDLFGEAEQVLVAVFTDRRATAVDGDVTA